MLKKADEEFRFRSNSWRATEREFLPKDVRMHAREENFLIIRTCLELAAEENFSAHEQIEKNFHTNWFEMCY